MTPEQRAQRAEAEYRREAAKLIPTVEALDQIESITLALYHYRTFAAIRLTAKLRRLFPDLPRERRRVMRQMILEAIRSSEDDLNAFWWQLRRGLDAGKRRKQIRRVK